MNHISENDCRCLLRTVINSIPSVLVYVDRSGRIVFWNDKAHEISAVETDAARGRVVWEVLPFIESIMKVIQRAIESGQVQRECRVSGIVNGVTRVFELAVYPHGVKDGNGERGAVIRADALSEGESTDEIARKTASQVPRTELTAEIAHEINNHLAGVLQNIQIIKNRLVGDLPKNRMLAEACGTTWEVIRAYVDKREIGPMIEAIADSGSQAAKAVTTALRDDRPDDAK
jgi:PAS domain S-box-containing protein